MNYLSKKEIQSEEEIILKKVAKFLDDNNINYSLGYGSLLGSIRHKGFIPWDDDIDLIMIRPEYEKFIQLIAKENCQIEELIVTNYRLKNGYSPFVKIMNKNIKTYNKNISKKYQMPIWIDIFPIDGMPTDLKKTQKLLKKNQKYKRMYMTRVYTYKKNISSQKTIIRKIFKILYKTIINFAPVNYISYKMDKLAQSTSYDKSPYAGNTIFSYGIQEKMDSKIFNKNTKKMFEGNAYKCIYDYDTYLKKLYGNYMELPPVEKRVTHSFDAWRE